MYWNAKLIIHTDIYDQINKYTITLSFFPFAIWVANFTKHVEISVIFFSSTSGGYTFGVTGKKLLLRFIKAYGFAQPWGFC